MSCGQAVHGMGRILSLPFNKTSNSELVKRLKICAKCPTNNNGWCGKPLKKTAKSCGCQIHLKARHRLENCPQNKWDVEPLLMINVAKLIELSKNLEPNDVKVFCKIADRILTQVMNTPEVEISELPSETPLKDFPTGIEVDKTKIKEHIDAKNFDMAFVTAAETLFLKGNK